MHCFCSQSLNMPGMKLQIAGMKNHHIHWWAKQPSKGIVERWALHIMTLQHLAVLAVLSAAQVYGLLSMYWLPTQNFTVSWMAFSY